MREKTTYKHMRTQTFRDYLEEIHNNLYPIKDEEDRDSNFENWLDNISRKEFVEYFTDYIHSLSSVEIARIADDLL